MRLQQRIPLLTAGAGGGGGSSFGDVPLEITRPSGYPSRSLYGYTDQTGVEDGDLVIFGYNYRSSGTGTPGTTAPTLGGGGVLGTPTVLTSNSRYDTGGTSDGGWSVSWAVVTTAGDGVLTLPDASNRCGYVFVYRGYNTIVQNIQAGGDGTTSVTPSLPVEPTGPVVAIQAGGGALDVTELTPPAGFTRVHDLESPTTGSYERWMGSHIGGAQSATFTCTANQVAAGGAFARLFELGNV